jgi:hypothetical protein
MIYFISNRFLKYGIFYRYSAAPDDYSRKVQVIILDRRSRKAVRGHPALDVVGETHRPDTVSITPSVAVTDVTVRHPRSSYVYWALPETVEFRLDAVPVILPFGIPHR